MPGRDLTPWGHASFRIAVEATMIPPDPNRVVIFDTTLRDGEQSPGATLNNREKLEIAQQLAQLGVDVIEAGFPIASPGDFEAVREVATKVKGPVICGLARCLKKDIDVCAEAIAPAGVNGRIHVFLATSAIHRQFKLRKAKEEILRQAREQVAYARTLCEDVQFSPEDATRTEREFLAQVVQAAIEAGATTINIPDTVGYTVPSEYASLIRYLREQVTGIDGVRIHVHCHNDLGMAVANSLAAVEAGARGVECTLNGIGERAGNCSMEEVVMALRTRADLFGDSFTNVETRRIYPTCKLAARLMNFPIPRGKPIVGANAFAHESGIHQDGMLKERSTYEIMRPEEIGIESGTDLVMGKHSGRHAFGERMKKLGFDMTDAERETAYNRFIALADKKKFIYDDDLLVIGHGTDDVPGVYRIEYLHVATGSPDTVPTATVRLSRDGVLLQDAATGDGPVDAVLRTIDRLTGLPGRLEDYLVQAVSVGKDAMGEVSLRVRFEDGRAVSSKAASTDIVEASAKAYIGCVNRLMAPVV